MKFLSTNQLLDKITKDMAYIGSLGLQGFRNNFLCAGLYINKNKGLYIHKISTALYPRIFLDTRYNTSKHKFQRKYILGESKTSLFTYFCFMLYWSIAMSFCINKLLPNCYISGAVCTKFDVFIEYFRYYNR